MDERRPVSAIFLCGVCFLGFAVTLWRFLVRLWNDNVLGEVVVDIRRQKLRGDV